MVVRSSHTPSASVPMIPMTVGVLAVLIRVQHIQGTLDGLGPYNGDDFSFIGNVQGIHAEHIGGVPRFGPYGNIVLVKRDT